MNQKKHHIFQTVLLASLLSSCAAIGSKTLYKTDVPIETDNWGIAPLETVYHINQFHFWETNEYFDNSIKESFLNYGIGKPVQLNKPLSYEDSNSSYIKKLCHEKKLKGLIIPKLIYVPVNYRVIGSNYRNYFDTVVYLKLFNKKGELVMHTVHNTYEGNTYLTYPKPEQAVYDGAKGAFKQLAKELGLKKKYESNN
ncbi:hypothetical protein IFO69_11810 [Echinicola sp. CAU 1574]|uniref:DUF4136 domain-containing protein n=1 Tax=Echinicola arenosa TaxID=2774144 RepID=A0ABR9AL55_9BACT|nr:hypothetical protein [Echinicola arenosa]MBD8489430.1 hypothetical protein [Echinicola arenosa]